MSQQSEEGKFHNERAVVVAELHKPAGRIFSRRYGDIRGLNETFQADLVDIPMHSKDNDGYKYLLTVIDIFSKYAWARPIKSKSGLDTTSAMEDILKEGRIPKNLHVDRGKEFYNKEFKKLMQNHKIHMYSTLSNMKASICERFNRTLTEKMWRRFSLRGNYAWTDILPDSLSEYNNTQHRTIRMKPVDVIKATEKDLRRRVYSKFKINRTKRIKFKIGDKIRISKFKHIFEKGYTPNWTTEVFGISTVRNTDPVTYELIDDRQNPIEGVFYEEELAEVKYSDVFLIEKVIKKRGKKLCVKWLGFGDSYNSWITESDI
uniref:Integrase catalytic domain-containing protein n=1 Tax=Bracon brevicornis TaxID=1563983 RepID=A0A6V7L737_9HYME